MTKNTEIKSVTNAFKFILPMLGEAFSEFGEVLSVFVGDVDKPKLNNYLNPPINSYLITIK